MSGRLDIGRVFSRVVSVYRAQAGLFLPAALVVYLPVAIISALAYDEGSALLFLVGSVVATIGSFWLQGVIVGAVDDIQDDRRDESVGSLFAKVRPVVGRLIVAGVVAALGIAIGLVLLIVPGLVLLTWWSLIIPVIVLERLGVLASFSRSRELVRGNGWRVFGVVVLFGITQAILSSILRALLSDAAGSFAGYAIGELIANTLVGPLSAIAVAVVYFELTRGGPARAPAAPGTDAFGRPESLGRPEAPFTPPFPDAPERPSNRPDPPKE